MNTKETTRLFCFSVLSPWEQIIWGLKDPSVQTARRAGFVSADWLPLSFTAVSRWSGTIFSSRPGFTSFYNRCKYVSVCSIELTCICAIFKFNSALALDQIEERRNWQGWGNRSTWDRNAAGRLLFSHAPLNTSVNKLTHSLTLEVNFLNWSSTELLSSAALYYHFRWADFTLVLPWTGFGPLAVSWVSSHRTSSALHSANGDFLSLCLYCAL